MNYQMKERQKRIKEILQIYSQAYLEKKEIDDDLVLNYAINELGCSMKLARQYIKEAKNHLRLTIKDIDKLKENGI